MTDVLYDYIDDIVPETTTSEIPTDAPHEFSRIPFTKKMICRLLKGATSVIVETQRGKIYNPDDLPRKGDIFYIGEPFVRQYGWKAGMYLLHKVTYLADNHSDIFETGVDILEPQQKLPAQAMLENEARFFIRVRKCSYRRFGKISLAKTIHDNVYNVKKYDMVLVIDFDVMTYEQVAEYKQAQSRERFINDFL